MELENYKHRDKFGEWLGYKVVHVDQVAHTAEVELAIREDHLSPSGRVHGGVISSFFDFSFGAAVFSTLGAKDYCSTVELKVNYLLPIDLNDRLIAKTSVIFRGKRLCVLQGMIYKVNQTGPVALGTATFNIGTRK